MEAGERLGFLPGTLQEKVDPYLRPLYDALFDMMESEKVDKLLERNTIEVAPIAFMRGRTLNDSFIILDEAQNSTTEQMKMVLTRTGFNSKMVVNGDITQIDLPPGKRSGLIDALEVLRGVEGISMVQFDERDVVRHTLVQRIVRAYERYNEAVGAGRQLSLKLTEPPAEAAPDTCPASDDHIVLFRRAPAELDRRSLEALRPHSARRSRQGRRFHVPHHRRRELRRLNREFLGKDYATDVLSFPPRMLRRPKPGRNGHLGWPVRARRRASSGTPSKTKSAS